jgi:hypothetical protein
MSATILRRAPHGQASTSSSYTLRSRGGQSMRAPTGLATPLPRPVRGLLDAAVAPAGPAVAGDTPS